MPERYVFDPPKCEQCRSYSSNFKHDRRTGATKPPVDVAAGARAISQSTTKTAPATWGATIETIPLPVEESQPLPAQSLCLERPRAPVFPCFNPLRP
jgi:hypothetical protein